jgi:chemotaxis protein MotB
MQSKYVREEEEESKGSPAWMTTYSDLFTLLLSFFVLLYAFSTIDVVRFRQVVSALQQSLGILEGGKTFMQEPLVTGGQYLEADWQQLEAIRVELQSFIEERDLSSFVTLNKEDRGLKLSFQGRVLFDLGKADLKPEVIEVLNDIAEMIREWPNHVRVEGHTDDLPIGNAIFPSNWELSVARAVRVLRFLVDEKKIDPKRISAVGYGEYRPILPNDSTENRAKNRRVDLVILRLSLQEVEPE